MTFDVQAARAEMPAARNSVYLNAGTFGPLSQLAHAAMQTHAAHSFDHGRIGNFGMRALMVQLEDARAAFASCLHCPTSEVALSHCTTDGLNSILWGLPFEAGDEVVTSTHEHPGLLSPLEAVARAKGIVIRKVEPTLEHMQNALTSKTKLIAISHVLWTNGHVMPVRDIASAAHAAGVHVLLDGAQGTGAFDFRVGDLGCDFYALSGQKWLCGPSGTGALWISPAALAQLREPWPSYYSQNRQHTPAQAWPGAKRLDATTVSMSALAGVIGALQFHQSRVVAGGLSYAAELAAYARTKLASMPAVELLHASTPSTLVSFRLAGRETVATAAHLEAMGILVRGIPGLDCLRISVGYWNNEVDIDTLIAAL
jgi:selenocysteine lyase/cysteine desulfurase